MLRTQRFRDQHEELLNIASKISGHFDVVALSKDASGVRTLVSQLLGRLTVHLAAEDKVLYPSLLENEEESVRDTTQRFIDEMGGIGAEVEKYRAKWNRVSAIQEAPKEFIAQSKTLFTALAERIDKENNELYVLFDRQHS